MSAPVSGPGRVRRAALVGATATWLLVGLDALAQALALRPAGLQFGGPILAGELGLVGVLVWLAVSLGHPATRTARMEQRVRAALVAGAGVGVALVLLTGGQAAARGLEAVAPATLLHWALAAAMLPIILGTTWLARPAGQGRTGPAFELAVTAAALYVIELLVGAAGAFTPPEAWVGTVHLLLGASVLACLVGAAAQLAAGPAGIVEPPAWPSAPSGPVASWAAAPTRQASTLAPRRRWTVPT
ncbi:MAG: hypothetical protein EPN50_06220, partial [Chloroflexota bacterium]